MLQVLVVGTVIGCTVTPMAMTLTILDSSGQCEVRILFHMSRKAAMEKREFQAIQFVTNCDYIAA